MLPPVQVRSSYWPFRGGLDQITPSITMPAGHCRASSNVEIGTEGALSVVQGYERYDGQARPSDAAYHTLAATITGSYALGNTLTGASSGATGVIIEATSTYFVLTKVVGTYTLGEDLQVSAVTVAVATDTNVQGAASTPALDATYKNLAADEYRGDIAEVPGSGSVLGVWIYGGDKYAVRNNAGGTAAVLHKDSASGWSAVGLGRELAFTSGGTTEIVDGQTITGATSGATAVVGRVVLTSGTWLGGDAAGFFYFASQTGTFQAENVNVGATLNLATISGNSSAITLTASGRYEFVNHNFGGGATGRMYGCSGVHKAFEWDGTTFAFITTGMVADVPDHIAVHKNQLFLSFGPSVQHAGPSDPFDWSVILGAAELAMGEDVTGFVPAPGNASDGAMVIYTRNRTNILYGNDATDWVVSNLNREAGAIDRTTQFVTQAICLDDRGITMLPTTQSFGNFQNADITALVRPYVATLRASAIASCIVRAKNQYRLFSLGGDALYVTFIGNKLAGAMPVSLPNPVTCICSLEGDSGVEEIYFGSSDGFVYQLEKGTSFDGDEITWSAELAFNHFGSPRQLKQFRKAIVECTGSGYCEFQIGYTLGYGNTDLPTGATANVNTTLATTAWDSSITWDAAFWDGQQLSPSEADLDGTAENISIIFAGSSDEFDPITLNGCVLDFTPRRQLR